MEWNGLQVKEREDDTVNFGTLDRDGIEIEIEIEIDVSRRRRPRERIERCPAELDVHSPR
jgi:hypothetical protein